MSYPQHELFKAKRQELGTAKRFLAFLQDDYGLKLIDTDDDDAEYAYNDATREEMIFEFCGIDYDEFKREKDLMVEELSKHAENP